MAVIITGSYFDINSLGDRAASWDITEVSVEHQTDQRDVTNFGSSGWKEFLAGLQSATIRVSAKDVNNVIDDLWALRSADTGNAVTFEVRETNAAISANNPAWTGSCLILGVTPVSTRVGEEHAGTFTFPVTGALTRDVTP